MSARSFRSLLLVLLSAPLDATVRAESQGIEEIQVRGREVDLVGEAITASQGVIGQAELELRPILRSGEVLEAVPGLVATQHSGTGKANQYFLRGFNLDHGTDFATSYGGMPVNMRTHGHGQGYTDLNFVIPELVQRIDYRKGPYYAEVGDFSSAGSAAIRPFAELARGQIEAGLGEDGFRRLLALESVAAAGGELLYALELNAYDGPWTDVQEDVQKVNATLRQTWQRGDGELSLMAMAYDNSWNSSDQIPLRAVQQGLIDELGSLDTGLGGDSSRYSLSASWDGPAWRGVVYAIDYSLDLRSNFTYYLDDPVDGDRFRQVDDRHIYGGELARRIDLTLAGREVRNTLGLQWRYDDIGEVGIFREARPVSSDTVGENSVGLYWDNEIRWRENWRSQFGLRWDRYDFEVDAAPGANVNGVDLGANSGKAEDAISSVKGSLGRRIGEHVELYVAAGQGFHSNDARGTTAHVDPTDGAPIGHVDPLVRSRGAETGVRFFASERLNASLALWQLDLDSELVFVGDAGTTEPSRQSERKGVEITAYYYLSEAWSLDIEYARAHAQFTERDPSDPTLGDHVPGALDEAVAAGLSARLPAGWFGSLRLRYFGPRDLDESGEVRSDSTTVLNLRAGYETSHLRITVDVLNLLDSDAHDIDYWYESRLAGESAPVSDVHYHVMEPRTVRVYAAYRF